MEKDLKTKDLPILFKENYKNWFKYAGIKIKKKGAYYSIESSKTEYVWIYRKERAAGGSRERKTIIPMSINTSGVNNFTSKFEQMGGLWNVE